MMSDSQEQVRNLFSLNKEEKILDDFGCSMAETIPIPGRLYLTEHYLCFGSNLFGFNRKFSISFNEITELRLKKSNLEIESKNNFKKKYSFTSFKDIQNVYKRIKSMCRSYNENISSKDFENKTKEEIKLSDSENSDEESEEFAYDKTLSSSKKMSYNSNSSNEDLPNSNNIITEDISNNIINNNNINKNIINNLNENKNSNEIKNNKSRKSINNGEKIKIKNEEVIGIHESISSKDLSSNSNIKRKKSSSSFKSKKSENDKSPNKNENNIIEEEEIKFNPIDKDLDFEVCRKIVNLSPKNFFEKYQTNTFPETSYRGYYEWVGDYTEVNMPDWEKIENPDSPEIEKYQRIESFCIALHGVPLINKSNVIKTLQYWIEKDGTYYIKASSKSQGVPLSDCFLIETTVELHPHMNNAKTVLRAYVRTNMIKSTIFRGTLISQGKKTFTQEINKWLQFIEEKGDKIEGDYVYKPKKRKNSLGEKHRALSHGVEKEISQMNKEKHIVDFKDFCYDIFFGTKKYAKLSYDYFYREFDKKTRVILICLFFIFLMLLSIIQGQNNEIRELKNEINDVKILLNDLTKIVLEFKNKNMGQ